jgi:serine/threonine-protein kinase RsbW
VTTDFSHEPVTITMPARAEYLHVIRTVVGSVAARQDLTIDAIEDLRIAVDEACSQLIATHGSTVTVAISPSPDGIEVTCSTDSAVAAWPPEGIQHTLASQVLRGLADDVAWDRLAAGPSIRVGKRGVAVGGR